MGLIARRIGRIEEALVILVQSGRDREYALNKIDRMLGDVHVRRDTAKKEANV